MLARALRADARDLLGVAAVVAQQAPVALVKGQGHGAVQALDALAARAARHKARKAAPVQQHDGLLAVFQALSDGLLQLPRKGRLLARFQKFLPHVDQFDHGHGPFFDAARQFQQRILAALGIVAAFQGGRGRTQHHARAGLLRPHHGHIAPVVARRLFLLVAAVVLFVDHDQAQVAHRRENAGPRPHHHRGFAGAYAPPLLGALDIRERAVQNGHPVAESKEELARHGRREGDFGHQQQGAAALRQHGFDGREIDFGFSRTGYAVQQECPELPGEDGLPDLLEGRLLRRIQLVPGPHRHGRHRHGLRLQQHQSLPRQGARRHAGVFDRALEVFQVMRAGMHLQKRPQLPFRFIQLDVAPAAGQLDAQSLRGRTQRIAIRLDLFGGDESSAFERAHRLIGQRQRLGQIGRRKRTPFQHAQDLRYGIVGRGIEHKLARGVAAGVGQRPHLPAPNLRRQRQHAAQHFAQWRAVVARDPAPQRQQFRIQHRLGIDQPERLARGHGRRLVMAAEDHARQPARSERRHDAAARPDAVPQCLGQRVGEWLIHRHRQADVAIEVRSLGHEPFRIRHRAPPGGMGAIISPSIRIFVGSPIGAWFSSALSATVSTYVVRFLPKLTEFQREGAAASSGMMTGSLSLRPRARVCLPSTVR